MNNDLAPYLGNTHIYILEQFGYNDELKDIYMEILEDFKFLMYLHVDTFILSQKDPNIDYGIIGYLPDGMIKDVAQTIDERFVGVSLPLKTCIWYEISTQLVQQSVFRMAIKR